MSAATELIEKALGVIRERGWTRHIREDNQGRVCALGALDIASGIEDGFEVEGSAYARAVELLDGMIPPEWDSHYGHTYAWLRPYRVAEYNNDHDQATVEHWFAKAALHEGIDV